MKFFSLVISTAFIGISCSSKNSSPLPAASTTSLQKENKISEDVSSESSSDEEIAGRVRNEEVFYSEITILVETVADMTCKDNVIAQSVSSQQPRSVVIDEAERLASTLSVDRSAINVTIEFMGLDSGRIERSLVDHGSLKEGDKHFLFRRRPGLGLELSYLGERLLLRGDATPVYSFSARETRSGCAVTHNVNVFQDRTGLFKRATFRSDH